MTTSHVKANIIAEEFGMTTGSVYKMARRGLIPFVRVGEKMKGLRFDPMAVGRALAQQPIRGILIHSRKSFSKKI